MKTPNIKVYLVGGAVRDQIIGRDSKDLDYVVVGATPEHMTKLGFTQVGADFPVFLHPTTGDEFALARTERKTAAGYHGFEVDFDVNVTLEDDLIRRDLTMNAMAIEVDAGILRGGFSIQLGEIIDPFNGQEDIKNRIIRQTSEAFAEDPLRVLRTARFAARYEFKVHEDTLTTMCDIVDSGELDALPMERVFTEFKKAMMEDRPNIFFDVLNKVDAIELYFRELCTWDTNEFKKAIRLGATFEERVCVLMLGFSLVGAKRMLTRIKAPNDLMNMVQWTVHMEELIDDVDFGHVESFTNTVLWNRLNKLNAWRNLEKIKAVFKVFLFVGGKATTTLDTILTAVHFGSNVGFDDLDVDTRDQLVGKEIGDAISQKRLEVLEELNLFPS